MGITVRNELGSAIIHPDFPWQGGQGTVAFWTQAVGPFEAPFNTNIAPLHNANKQGYRFVAVIGGLAFHNNRAHPVSAEHFVWLVRGPGGMH
jgi:hypothetical protein